MAHCFFEIARVPRYPYLIVAMLSKFPLFLVRKVLYCAPSYLLLFSSFCACLANDSFLIPSLPIENLAKRHFYENLSEDSHFPLLSSLKGSSNFDPDLDADARYLFYVTNTEGSNDIWVRNLITTFSTSLFYHPSEQRQPTVDANAQSLFFVSEDSDEKGDLLYLDLNIKGIKERIDQSVSLPNLWKFTENFSRKIEQWSQKHLAPACHGAFGEQRPDLSAQGDQLLFVSDRCTPGVYNIWLAKLGKTKKILELSQLTQSGASFPSFNRQGDRIVFLASSHPSQRARIYLLEMAGERFKLNQALDLATHNLTGQEIIYASPIFSENENEQGERIVYISIRQDSNGDGKLTRKDDSGIYSFQLDPWLLEKKQVTEPVASSGSPSLEKTPQKPLAHARISPDRIHESPYEASLLEPSTSIGSLTSNSRNIVYSAFYLGHFQIYLLSLQGVIPKEASIEAQYRLSQRIAQENPLSFRYILALEAVAAYFRSSELYFLYDAYISVDKWLFYSRLYANETDPKLKKLFTKRADYLYHQIQASIPLDRPSYLELYFQSKGSEIEGLDTPKGKWTKKAERDYLFRLYGWNFAEHSQAKFKHERILRSHTLYRIVQHYYTEEPRDITRALIHVRLLNREYPDYYLRKNSLLLELDIVLTEVLRLGFEKKASDTELEDATLTLLVFSQAMLSEFRNDEQFAQQVCSILYKFYTEHPHSSDYTFSELQLQADILRQSAPSAPEGRPGFPSDDPRESQKRLGDLRVVSELAESTHPSLPSMLQQTLNLIRAYYLYKEGQYEQSLALAFHVRSFLPRFRSVASESHTSKEWAHLTQNCLFLIQENFKILGNQKAYFETQSQILHVTREGLDLGLQRRDIQNLLELGKDNVINLQNLLSSLMDIYQQGLFSAYTLVIEDQNQEDGKKKSKE